MKQQVTYEFGKPEIRRIEPVLTSGIHAAVKKLVTGANYPNTLEYLDHAGDWWLRLTQASDDGMGYVLNTRTAAPAELEPSRTIRPITNEATLEVCIADDIWPGIRPENVRRLARTFGAVSDSNDRLQWRDPAERQIEPNLTVRGIALVLTSFAHHGDRDMHGTHTPRPFNT